MINVTLNKDEKKGGNDMLEVYVPEMDDMYIEPELEVYVPEMDDED